MLLLLLLLQLLLLQLQLLLLQLQLLLLWQLLAPSTKQTYRRELGQRTRADFPFLKLVLMSYLRGSLASWLGSANSLRLLQCRPWGAADTAAGCAARSRGSARLARHCPPSKQSRSVGSRPVASRGSKMGAVLGKVRALAAEYGARRVLGALVAMLLFRSTLYYKLLYKLKNQPPGPMPLPVIGNFNHLSPPNTPPGLHKDLFRLSKAFGPVYSLHFGSNYGVVCNSREAFYEALKTKQDEFARRPCLPSFEAITHGQGVAMNNGERWRMIRTVLQTTVTNKQKGVESEALFMEEIGNGLSWLRSQCERGKGADFDMRSLLRREAINGIMRKVFSCRFGDANTPEFVLVSDFIKVIFEHIAQASPSDFMPIAKYFPNAEEKHYFKTALVMERYIDNELDKHKLSFDRADPAQYDFLHAMLAAQKEARAKGEPHLSDIDIRVCAWDSMAGGIDTASTTLEWALYLMVNFKAVQHKAQKILDEVVGPNRLPCLDDVPKLDFITAIIDEVFRFKHFAPQGLPHEAEVDTTLLGYNVPKGTQVFFNYYSLHMNPEYWLKPEEFRPQRFLEEEKDLLNTCLHPETYFAKPESYKFVPFGQGRRRCVGYGIGRIAVWLKVATYLHCFEWDSADGKPFDIDTEILGITMVPKEQKFKATPRPAARLCKSLEGLPGFDQR